MDQSRGVPTNGGPLSNDGGIFLLWQHKVLLYPIRMPPYIENSDLAIRNISFGAPRVNIECGSLNTKMRNFNSKGIPETITGLYTR